MDVRRSRAAQRRGGAERLEDGAREVLLEGHLGGLGDGVGEPLEARVRVDPPLAGLRDRRVALERQAGRLREQVPHG